MRSPTFPRWCVRAILPAALLLAAGCLCPVGGNPQPPGGDGDPNAAPDPNVPTPDPNAPAADPNDPLASFQIAVVGGARDVFFEHQTGVSTCPQGVGRLQFANPAGEPVFWLIRRPAGIGASADSGTLDPNGSVRVDLIYDCTVTENLRVDLEVRGATLDPNGTPLPTELLRRIAIIGDILP